MTASFKYAKDKNIFSVSYGLSDVYFDKNNFFVFYFSPRAYTASWSFPPPL